MEQTAYESLTLCRLYRYYTSEWSVGKIYTNMQLRHVEKTIQLNGLFNPRLEHLHAFICRF